MLGEILTRIGIGLLIMGGGFLMTWQTQFFLENIGPIEWADRNLGGGGSRTFYKLAGIGISVIGMIVATNLFDRIIGSFLRSIFGS